MENGGQSPAAEEKISMLRAVMTSVGELGASLKRNVRAAKRKADLRRLIDSCHALLSERGEASGVAIASDSISHIQALDVDQTRQFFAALVADFSPQPTEVMAHAHRFATTPSQANLVALQRAAEAPRQELFRRLNMAPGGTAALVSLRKQLLGLLDEQPELVGVDSDLLHLFQSWFNRGFLELRRIDWQTSAAVLEKLIAYEAVHAMRGWEDLRRRLDRDRRCFAFFHPALPGEPLIFVEVALTDGMAASVQPLLASGPITDTAKANCAIFYSITNCQEGLRGVSFGNFLIKQVAADLQRELPRLKTFATLSPIPGFRRWLDKTLPTLVDPAYTGLAAQLASPDWASDADLAARMAEPLTRLCASYLVHAKRGTLPLDPVERFHLANGARLERINWRGDTSEKGIRESATLMVNYVYALDDVEANHQAYATQNTVVASRQVLTLAARAVAGANGKA